MKTNLLNLLSVFAVVAVLPAHAVLTTNWPFTTPSQYTLSNSNKIEVADGVAKLKLQVQRPVHATFGEYTTTNTTLQRLSLGQDASVVLTGAGGLFSSFGTFVSRVIDGGIGNEWKGLRIKGSQRDLGAHYLGETATTEPNLMGLYHFNGTWADSVSGSNGIPLGGAQFSSTALLGSQSVWLDGASYVQLSNPTLLNGEAACTLTFWCRQPVKYSTDYAGMLVARSASHLIGLYQMSSGYLAFYVESSFCFSSIALPTNQWVFVSASFNSGSVKLYINGVQRGGMVTAVTSIPVYASWCLGADTYSANRRATGFFDDVCIYNRELSSGQILSLYGRRLGNLGVRIRSGQTPQLSGDFVGPDGTQSSYFMDESSALLSVGPFSKSDQYIQYQASLGGDLVRTPYLASVKFMGLKGEFGDDVQGDFVQGSFERNTTNAPKDDTPIVMLAKGSLGVVTNGAFTSRVFDAGSIVAWVSLSWNRGPELPANLYGMAGLWHMNGAWTDAIAGRSVVSKDGDAFTTFSKLGNYSAVFNGTNTYINFGDFQTNLQSAEVWINTDSDTGGILEFGASCPWVSVSNQMITINGWSNTPPEVYVNGGQVRQLLPGWNHIALVFPAKIVSDNLTIGLARGNYFSGRMDEFAVYNRALTSPEISEHFVMGRRETAGQIRFQVRADNVNPIQTAFSGNYASPLSLPSVSGQYFQYRAILEGDGTASPALSSVTVTKSDGSVVDRTKEDFLAGDLSGTTVRLHGAEMSLSPLVSSGPLNLLVAESTSLLGLWHMDDAQWTTFSPSVGDELGLNSGIPYTGATVVDNGAVGLRCGLFSGTGYIALSGIQLSANNFTVSAWFKTSAGGRAAVLSSWLGSGAYYALEVNGDGSSSRTGMAAFVLSDGAVVAVPGNRTDLNDGQWHHLAGVRNGLQAHLYIDGLLAGTAPLSSSFGAVDNISQSLSIARHGNQGFYFNGNIDEVVIHGRVLTEGEIGDLAARSFATKDQGQFVGPVIDAGLPAYWDKLYWGCDAAYSQPLKPDASMAGLWHFESISNNFSVDASGYGNDIAVPAGVSVSANGRFANGLSLAGTQTLQVNDNIPLRVDSFSVEAWINPSNAPSLTVAQKSSGSPGFTLGTDASGRPFLRVNGVTTTDSDILRARKWNHLCGTHDGQTAKLYVNGLLKGSVAVSGSALNSATLTMGNGLAGLIDEAALYSRVLNTTEVLDHYRAGIGTLKFQARSFPTSTPQGNFVGPDGTTNTWFVDFDGSSLVNLPPNQYFQYKAVLASEDTRFSPVLDSIRVDYSFYPGDNPWVAPADRFGAPYLGNLTAFSHILSTTNSTAVHYQISGNNGTNWYAWFGGSWLDVTGYSNPTSQWTFSNTPDVISTNIGTFYTRLYQGLGGIFKFRAFLKWDSLTQVKLDEVDLNYSAGRIVVLTPNGLERGDNAVVLGSPLAITWSSAGKVTSTNIIIELYNAGNLVTPVQTVASGVTNSGRYWGAFNVSGPNFLLRIRDGSDPTVEDWSDGPFTIANKPRITQPNGGEQWRLLDSNVIKWDSPNPVQDTTMLLWFSNDNGANWLRVATRPNQAGTNEYLWPSQAHDWRLLSESALMGVSVPGPYSRPSEAVDQDVDMYDISDTNFVMAGIVVTNPAAGVRLGTTNAVQWISAAAGTNVSISISVDGGNTWNLLAQDVPNTRGANSYNCLITAPNPNDAAVIRVTSQSNTNLYGDSLPFALADIRILSPVAGMSWQLGSTNDITWVTGGASNLVNVSYCTDGTLTNWVPIITNKANLNSSTGAIITNVVSWVVTGTPTASAVIRIDAIRVPGLYANSDPFAVTGVRLLSPLGDPAPGSPMWEFAGTNSISWVKYPAGGNVQLDISYVSPVTTNDYETLATVGSRFTPFTLLPGQVRRPTATAKVRITVVGIDSNSMQMVDTSPNFFTIRGVSMVAPTTNAMVTLGTTVTNGLQWYAAMVGNSVNFFYAADGLDFADQIVSNRFIVDGLNQGNWTISDRLLPTTTARVKVITTDRLYSSISPVFTVRGIRVTQPAAGVMWDLGSQQTVSMVAAGLFRSTANAIGEVSLTGGTPGSYVSGNLSSNILVTRAGISQFTWDIDPALDPTTNAVIRVRVFSPTNDADVVTVSDPFVIRGLKIVSPATGTNWLVGSSHPVTFLAAGLGGSDKANLYYSSDGVTFDATPLTNNLSVVNGLNSVDWTIDSSRQPSSNAVLMVVSGMLTNLSSSFTVGGIKVTTPNNSDIWAVSDVTNTIQWVSIGVPPPFALWYTVYSNDVPVRSGAIASNVFGNAYVWTMSSNAIGDTVTISLTDGHMTNESPYFSIVPAPSIRIITPVAGEFWKVSETNNVIRWKPAGTMEDNFTVTYWSAASGLQPIRSGSFPLVGGYYECPWSPIPDALGEVHVTVSNKVSSLIVDTITNFTIAAKFDFYPILEDVYARSTLDINWDTRGSVSSVDLFYTTDPSSTNNWIAVNPGNPYPIITGEPGSYRWIVPNYNNIPVWFRIQDHSYAGRRFDVSKKGPYDDLGPFLVRYYPVVWRVFDVVTSNELSGLSVVDSSSFSFSSVNSPVTFFYPAGEWNTVWSKQYFNDKVVLNWKTSLGLTNVVYMSRTEASPEYHVMANFIFDPLWNVFRAVTWLERSSKIISAPTECDVTVYDPEGNEKGVTKSFSPQTNGVFWMDIPALSESNRPYFAKVEIKSAGVVYTSGITFTLLQPSESAVSAVNSARDAILGSVSNVNNNVTDVGIAVGAMRGDVTNRLTSLSNTTAQIRVDVAGVSSNLSSFSSNALAQIGLLTNTVGVIGPTGTNMTDQLRNLTQEVDKRSARILTRPTSVKIGSTFNVFYRSQPGSAPSLTVSNGVFFASYGMTELSNGFFEKLLTAAAGWGIGDVTVSIYEGTSVSDRMIIKVTASEIDDLAGSMGSVSNQLAQVELILGTMSGSVSNINRNVSGMTTNLTDLISDVNQIYLTVSNMPSQLSYLTNVIDQVVILTNINPAVAALTSSVAQIIILTNMPAQLAYVTNAVGQLSAIPAQMTSMTNSMARLNLMTNTMNSLSSQMAYVTNVIDQIVVLTNINSAVAAMTGAVAQITVLTNMSSQLGFVTNVVGQMGVLTNLTPQMASLTNSMAKLITITNSINSMAAQMAYMTNVIDQITALTNINPAVSAMTGAVAQITVLTNVGSQIAYLTNAMASLSGITNIVPQIGSLTNMTASIAGQTSSLTNLMTRMAGLTNLTPQVGYLTNSMAMLLTLTNTQAQLTTLTNTITQLSALTNINAQVSSMTNAIGQIAGMTNLPSQMNYLTNVIGQLSGMTNINDQVSSMTNAIAQIAGMTNLPGQMNYMTNIMSQLTGITNIGSQVSSMTNAIGQIAGLTNFSTQMNYMTNIMGQLTGITNIGSQVSSMTNAIGQIAGLTNFSSQMNYMTNIMGQLTGITNIGSQVSSMTNAIGQIAALTNLSTQVASLTNLPDEVNGLTNMLGQLGLVTSSLTNLPTQLAGMSNIISQLAGITNIGPQVESMTNAISQISALTNMPGQMNDITNFIGQLSGITNISSQVTSMTNAIGQIAGMTNLPGQMSYLTNAMSQLTLLTNLAGQVAGLTNLSTQVAGLTNLPLQIAGLTNLPYQVSSLSNVIGQLTGLTNMADQVAVMTNAIAQIATMTNLQAQVNYLTNLPGQVSYLTNVPSQVSSLTNMTLQLSSISNLYTSIESRIGSGTDVSTMDTVFGRLAALEANVATVGSSATAAGSKASGARSQASAAAGAATRIKQEVASGQMPKVMEDLNIIRKSLESALSQVKDIPTGMSTADMAKTLNDAAETMKKMAAERGLGGQLGSPTKVEPGSLTDPKAMADLLNKLSETKAMMEATRLLMDNAINKPVVVDWLEGSK